MRLEDRLALRQRYHFRCGYCGVSEEDTGAELTVDHFQPRSRGGSDLPENLVYCCFTCNNRKGDAWSPELPNRILHPLRDTLSEHLVEEDNGTMRGLTETGQFHITRLELNRLPLVAHRLARRRNAALSDALREALRRREELERRVEALERAIDDAEQRLRGL